MSDQLMGFVCTAAPEVSKTFYENVLGLTLERSNPHVSVFVVDGVLLYVTTVESLEPQPHTVLGFRTEDIAARMQELRARGVEFSVYEGFGQVDGIWTTPGGDQVAWFADPDGNMLSLTQFA